MLGRRLALAIALIVPSARPASGQVRVVDMIPRHYSNETFQNTEPTLAVNPVNPAIMASSMLVSTQDLCTQRSVVPVFVTHDSGSTWQLICKLPVSQPSSFPPGDYSLRWSTDGKKLFAAFLWPVATLQVAVAEDLMNPRLSQFAFARATTDQPNMEVVNVGGVDNIIIAADFLDATAGTAGMVSLTAPGRVVAPPVPSVIVEQREIFGKNYAVRVAVHPSGIAYGIFYSPDTPDGNSTAITVVRDDGRSTARTFTALVDTPAVNANRRCGGHDGKAGVRVVQCRPMPNYNGADPNFGGQRRIWSNLTIAADPTDSTGQRVFIAWSDSTDANHYTLHVRDSEDGGMTWSDDHLAIPNATNPSLSVGADGRAGLLFQQLEGERPIQRWVTRLYVSPNSFSSSRQYVLATAPTAVPNPQFQPYLGDYLELRSLGTTFYGVFSSSNVPDPSHFPNGVKFQRRYDPTTRQLLDGTGRHVVEPSIDPFFFSIGPAESAECNQIRAGFIREANVEHEARQGVGTKPRSGQLAAADAMAASQRVVALLRARYAEIGCRPEGR